MQDALSLVDVLTPPDNQWLKKLSWSKANLPAGIRVVRFSDAGDDESDPPDLVAVAITLGGPRKCNQEVEKRQDVPYDELISEAHRDSNCRRIRSRHIAASC